LTLCPIPLIFASTTADLFGRICQLLLMQKNVGLGAQSLPKRSLACQFREGRQFNLNSTGPTTVAASRMHGANQLGHG
jgi:hypothetical protein